MLPELTALAGLVREVGRDEVLPRFGLVERHLKVDGSIVTEADHASQARLAAELSRRWPAYGMLAEESTPDEQARRLAEGDRGLWVVDPLDGTSNFAAGLPYFAVSVALVRGPETVLGVVYDPVRDEWFGAERGQGAYHNGAPLPRPPPPPPMRSTLAVVDFKRLPADLAMRLATAPPYGSQRSLGAVALDWCWLAAGRFHLYLHGRQRLWDYAAGELVLLEAGGHGATLQGRGRPRPSLEPRTAVAAADRSLFEAWTAWLGVPS
jgi:myo-inositol-1(or 4)-monophosphatase